MIKGLKLERSEDSKRNRASGERERRLKKPLTTTGGEEPLTSEGNQGIALLQESGEGNHPSPSIQHKLAPQKVHDLVYPKAIANQRLPYKKKKE